MHESAFVLDESNAMAVAPAADDSTQSRRENGDGADLVGPQELAGLHASGAFIGIFARIFLGLEGGGGRNSESNGGRVEKFVKMLRFSQRKNLGRRHKNAKILTFGISKNPRIVKNMKIFFQRYKNFSNFC